MVFSQICDWLNDFVEGSDVILVDTWDCTEWLSESEIISVFEECVTPTFKTKKGASDATQILHALIWEYYLFRRAAAFSEIVYSTDDYERLKSVASVQQHSPEWLMEKCDLITASEFSKIIKDGAARYNLILEKTVKLLPTTKQQRTVFISNNGSLEPMAWGHRFEPVVKQIYESVTGFTVYSGLGRLRHSNLKRLAASPDGVVSKGCLLEIKAPLTREIEDDEIPYEYYCQMQVQMEVCNVQVCDYCECRFRSGSDFIDMSGCPAGQFVGSVAVVGLDDDYTTWKYVYSPLFPDTETGRCAARAWEPHFKSADYCQSCKLHNIDGQTTEYVSCSTCSNPEFIVLEKCVWQLEAMQLIPVLRNPRWWTTVGLPEYNRFCDDLTKALVDPMYLTPAKIGINKTRRPMFLDDDELYQ
jgi:putative phage-type endonuclease